MKIIITSVADSKGIITTRIRSVKKDVKILTATESFERNFFGN